MRFTVTGATGFIGRRLVERLVAAGRQVHILSRRPHTGLPPEIVQSIWDPEKSPPPEASLSECDVVVHLAGEPIAQRWSPKVKRRIRESRVKGAGRLVEGLAGSSSRPRVLISASAIGLYGDRGDEVLTECSSPGSGFLPEVCIEWEKAAAAAESLGVRTVTLRNGIVLGKDDGALAKMLPAFRAGIGGRIGSGRQWMSWIHMDDLIGMILFAATSESLRGPMNGVGPNPVTNAEFTVALGRALRRPAMIPTPLFMLRLLFGEMSEIVTGSQRVMPRVAQDAGFEFGHPEVFAALKDVLGGTAARW